MQFGNLPNTPRSRFLQSEDMWIISFFAQVKFVLVKNIDDYTDSAPIIRLFVVFGLLTALHNNQLVALK